MSANPFQSPNSPTDQPVVTRTHRVLWYGTVLLITLGVTLTVVGFGCAIADAINGWGSPMGNVIMGSIFLLLFSLLCIPQYLSVIRKSVHWARFVMIVSLIGFVIALITAVVYPIVEYNYSYSPPGAEILGAAFSLFVAILFLGNRWLHKKWIMQVRSATDQSIDERTLV